MSMSRPLRHDEQRLFDHMMERAEVDVEMEFHDHDLPLRFHGEFAGYSVARHSTKVRVTMTFEVDSEEMGR